MSEYYSPSRGGFFDDQINRVLPDDCVKLKPGQRQTLLAALATGKIIRVTGKGNIQAITAPPPDIDDQRERLANAINREAQRRILQIAPMWRQLNDLRAVMGSDQMKREAAQARLDAIDAVRARSDRLRIFTAGASTRQLAQLDITATVHWPAPEQENDA